MKNACLFRILAIFLALLCPLSCTRTVEKRTQKISVNTEPAGAKVWIEDSKGQTFLGESPLIAGMEYEEKITDFNEWWWMSVGASALLTIAGGLGAYFGDGELSMAPLVIGAAGLVGGSIACGVYQGAEGTEPIEKTVRFGASLKGYETNRFEIKIPNAQGKLNLFLRPEQAAARTATAPAAKAEPGPRRSIVAVFDINDVAQLLKKDEVAQLTTYLGVAIATTGLYKTIPRDQIRARLLNEKKGSYNACMDESCQIELGKTLAAQKSLATQLLKVGKKCAVTASLYDLKTETVEKGAMVNTGCSPDQLLDSMKLIAQQLASN